MDGLKRDLDKAREKCAAAEGKLKTALAEKSTATAEKANLEREVCSLDSLGILDHGLPACCVSQEEGGGHERLGLRQALGSCG